MVRTVRFCLLPSILSCLALAWPANAHSAEPPPPRHDLQEQFRKIAKEIKQYLDKVSAKDVALGEFTPSPDSRTKTVADPLLRQVIETELMNVKVVINDKSECVLSAVFSLNEKDKEGFHYWTLNLQLRLPGQANPINLPTPVKTKDMRILPQLLGVTGVLTPTGSAVERNQELGMMVAEPKVHLDGEFNSRIGASKESQYRITILAKKPDGVAKERSATVRNGEAFMNLDLNEEYMVRIENATQHEPAVKCSIDGIDIFEFSEEKNEQGSPKFGYYIVPAAKENKPGMAEIAGWQMKLGTVKPFKITELGGGAAGRLNRKDQVGTITVAFADCYLPNDPRGNGRAANVETGFGQEIIQPQVSVERRFDVVKESVTIRYSRTPTPGR